MSCFRITFNRVAYRRWFRSDVDGGIPYIFVMKMSYFNIGNDVEFYS